MFDFFPFNKIVYLYPEFVKYYPIPPRKMGHSSIFPDVALVAGNGNPGDSTNKDLTAQNLEVFTQNYSFRMR